MNIVCGDIHGEWDRLIQKIKALDLRDCNFIQAGDFGVGFERVWRKQMAQLKNLNDYLILRNIQLYAIRGNHDDPSFFASNPSFKFSNITFLPDYSTRTLGDNNILFIGGAISVDRKANPNFKGFYKHGYKGRKVGINYWPDEKVVFDKEKLLNISGIDTVITHTAPSFAEPILKHGAKDWFDSDPTLEEELDEERQIMTNIYNILKERNQLRIWLYGHFHFNHSMSYEDTNFRLPDIAEFYELC